MGRPKKNAAKKPAAKKQSTPRQTKSSGNDEYRGQISQDEKNNHWLNGGIFPVGRVLWPSLFSTRLSYNGKDKESKGKPTTNEDREFAVTLVFKKSDPRLKSMEKKIAELAAAGLGRTGKNAVFNSPIKDGDEVYKSKVDKYEDEKGIKYKSGADPIIDIYKNSKFCVLKRPAHLSPIVVLDEYGEEMLSKEHFYPGCYAVAQADFKCYTTFGGGITAYWKGIKKVAEGEKIGFDQTKRVKGDFDSAAANVSVDENGNVVY